MVRVSQLSRTLLPRLTEIRNGLSELVGADGAAFPIAVVGPLPDGSVIELLNDLEAHLVAIGSLDPEKHPVFPHAGVIAAEQQLHAMEGRLDSLLEGVRNLKNSEFNVSSEGIFSQVADGEVAFDPRENLRAILEIAPQLSNFSALVCSLSTENAFSQRPRIGQITARALAIATQSERESASLVKAARSTLKEATVALENIRVLVEQVQSQKEACDRSLAGAEAETNRISEKGAEADAGAARIKGVEGDVTNLKTEIQEFISESRALNETYAKEVGDGKKVLLQASEQVASAREQSDTLTRKVSALSASAEQMLTGATVAGLASTFDKERRRLGRAIIASGMGFVFGVLALITTSAFLASYVYGVDLGGLAAGKPTTVRNLADVTLAGVTARSVLMMGPVWLTWLFARMLRDNFELSQHYAHKHNMAVSVEGFKKQAPKYAEEVATYLMMMISANPANAIKRKGRSDSPPRDLFDTVVGELSDAVRKIPGIGARRIE